MLSFITVKQTNLDIDIVLGIQTFGLNMVDWRSFAVTFLLHAWIVPKFVCSQHKCLGGFDIYFILDR